MSIDIKNILIGLFCSLFGHSIFASELRMVEIAATYMNEVLEEHREVLRESGFVDDELLGLELLKSAVKNPTNSRFVLCLDVEQSSEGVLYYFKMDSKDPNSYPRMVKTFGATHLE